VGIADYPADPSQRGDFGRGPLSVTAGDEDIRSGVVAMDAADEAAGVNIGAVSYGAGVQDDEIGGGGIAYGEVTLVDERGFDGCAVGLGCTAAEALDEYAFAESVHSFIVGGILKCACAVGQLLEEPRKRGIERKVRSSKGGMPANGRGFALKAHATDSATENIPLAASVVSKGEKVRQERTAGRVIAPGRENPM